MCIRVHELVLFVQDTKNKLKMLSGLLSGIATCRKKMRGKSWPRNEPAQLTGPIYRTKTLDKKPE